MAIWEFKDRLNAGAINKFYLQDVKDINKTLFTVWPG